MKFLTPLFGLIAFSSIILSTASSIDSKIINQLTDQCKGSITENDNEIYNKCNIEYRATAEGDFKSRCKLLQSDECLKYYENPLSFFPSCENDPVIIKYADFIKNTASIANKFYCTADRKEKKIFVQTLSAEMLKMPVTTRPV